MEKVKKAVPEIIDLSLVGTIATEERVNKKKGTTNTVYVLPPPDGQKINLPKSKGIQLNDLLGVEVKVAGKGYHFTNKKGVKFTKVKKITGVEKISK